MSILQQNVLIISVITIIVVLITEVIARNTKVYTKGKRNKKSVMKNVRKLQSSILCVGLIAMLIISALQYQQINTEQNTVTDHPEPMSYEDTITVVNEVVEDDIKIKPKGIKEVETESAESYKKFLKENS